jgi:ADP-ribosylglycohydrolase
MACLSVDAKNLQVTRERYRGALLGLAAGDALGTTLEFERPGKFAPFTDMVGGGPFHLKPGEWTDDTSVALCLAESLVEKRGFDAKGFDIGNTVRSALENYLRTGNSFSGSKSPDAAGNGSLMRLAPIPLFFASNPKQAIHYAGESSRTTHGTKMAVDACRYFAGLIVGTLRGTPKSELLSPYFCPVDEANFWDENGLDPNIAAIAAGSFKRKEPPKIRGTGFVVESLEAALTRPEPFTVKIAGAFYGVVKIPPEWRAKLAMHDFIQEKADQLFAISELSNSDS